MDWNNFITILLTGTIPALVTYLIAKNKSDARAFEITQTFEKQIQALELTHKNEMERLRFEAESKKQNKIDEAAGDFVQQLVKGEIDVSQLKKDIKKVEGLKKSVSGTHPANKR